MGTKSTAHPFSRGALPWLGLWCYGRRSARGVGDCAIAGEASAQGGSRATELVLLFLLLTD